MAIIVLVITLCSISVEMVEAGNVQRSEENA